MTDEQPQFLEVGTGAASRRIAWLRTSAAGTAGLGVFWLSGFMSDMVSTKATALAEWAVARGHGCTRFDYSGHGQSEGKFTDGTIGRWLEEAEAAYMRLTAGPQIVVGSSMGGYIALLLLRRLMERSPGHAARLKALVLIAPAWDMTEELMWKKFPESAKVDIQAKGVFLRPSLYGAPYPITRQLIEEGRSHLLARSVFDPGRPIRIMHGLQDPDVPWEHTLDLVSFLDGDWTQVAAIPDGEHRLSRPQDLEMLTNMLDDLAGQIQ
jgi:pimeloyl-ACP methyl ester carboxylesterase